MIAADDAALERWRPDLEPQGRSDLECTRASCAGTTLCNALEWAHWVENPVQVLLCETCGHDGCAQGGYVHVSRLADRVLWTRPQLDSSDPWQQEQYEAAWPLWRFGAITLSLDTWERWRERASSAPTPQALPVAGAREVLDAWLLGLRGAQRLAAVDELVPRLRERLLGADSSTSEEAIQRVERIRADLSRHGDGPVPGRLARAADVDARVERLYFDGPAEEDWPALAVLGGRLVPAFSQEWVLAP